MEQFEIIIDNQKVKVNSNQTILEAAKSIGINIPTLCYLKDINEPASCRVCVVEVEGARNLVTSCNTKVRPNMVVNTTSERVLNARKTTVELLLSNHNKNCLSCSRNLNCTLQKLSKDLHCDADRFKGEVTESKLDFTSPSIVRDQSKCILCGRCVAVCSSRQGVDAIGKIGRGFNTTIGCAFEKGLEESTCVGCGQCINVCPTGALREVNDINKVLGFLNDKEVETVVQVAPSVRVALAEEFGAEIGTFCEGKMVSALRKLGFNHIYDVNVAADFTIVEESKELLDRINNKTAPLPMFTSCCPGWYKFAEEFAPEFIPNISTCKSPNEMLGSLVKYYFEKQNKKVRIVSIMPCTAKKHEIRRNGEIDANLTTRELAELIRHKNIDFNALNDEKFDNPFGTYSGAALIFGATGGVMEAALRTANKYLNKDEKPADIEVVRNSIGRKEVEIKTDTITLKVAIVNGLQNAKNLLKDIKEGKADFHFIEVMACPGGCVNGGGQPIVDYSKTPLTEVIKKRTAPLYKEDSSNSVRASHENKAVLEVYKNLLNNDEELIHKLLHIHGTK